MPISILVAEVDFPISWSLPSTCLRAATTALKQPDSMVTSGSWGRTINWQIDSLAKAYSPNYINPDAGNWLMKRYALKYFTVRIGTAAKCDALPFYKNIIVSH